jgi:type II secretory pathway pseudopilin PulG
MTIIGVLAGIVVPAVSGTKEASNDAEVREGAFTVQSATNDFFAAQASAEVVKPLTPRLNANINGEEGINDAFTQKIGTRWPEKYVTGHDTHMGAYAVEFRTSTTTTESKVRKVILRDQDGSPISRNNLLLRYTALDFDILIGFGRVGQPIRGLSLQDTQHGGQPQSGRVSRLPLAPEEIYICPFQQQRQQPRGRSLQTNPCRTGRICHRHRRTRTVPGESGGSELRSDFLAGGD